MDSSNYGTVRMYPERCLRSEGFNYQMPDCGRSVRIYGQPDWVYSEQCLRDAGFRFPPLIERIPDGQRIDVSAEQLPELDADFVFATWRSDTGGKPQDELQAMEGVMPGWCDFLRACRTGHYILLPREEVISNSYAALSLMVAQVQSHIAGRPIPAEAK